MNELASLNSVKKLERQLLQMPQAEIETIHSFLDGIYERKIVIPPWTVLTGAPHRTPYRVRLEVGTIAVNTGDGIKVLSAPFEFEAPAGVTRVGRVFADPVVWVDVYMNADNCTELQTLEQRLYEVPECGLGENREQARIDRDRDDYARFQSEFGFDDDKITRVMAITHDLVQMPQGFAVEIAESRIHGLGLFALRYLAADDIICPGRLNWHRTPAGRFINHSADPNAKPVKHGDDIFVVARRWIFPQEEITVDYRESMMINEEIVKCLAG